MSVALSWEAPCSPDAGQVEVLALYGPLLERLAGAASVDERRSALVDEAGAVWSRPGFDTVLSESRLAFTPFDYQLATMQTVLRRMRGRAILADEVGLGKTIEAGLVLSELRMRGLADRALVVTPAGLVGQWREELERKFALPTTVAARGGWESDGDRPVVLASLAAARRDPLKAAVLDERWDVVIVDEAHRLRNPSSASGRLARALRTRYLLLLTATPVENRLQDLYELVNLVAPGLLGTAAQFHSTHGNADAGVDALRNVAALRARTREIMVRHRRSEVAVLLPQRLAETVLVTPCDAERSLYADIVARIRDEARSASPARLLTLRSLTRLAGSSPAAVAPTLDKVGWADLTARARAIERPRKTGELLARLRTHVERGEKVLVFTAFRHTLDALAAEVEAAGIPAACYHGSLSRRDKDAAVEEFRGDVPVLLSTESAGEGRNLQFCHVMINVDLPWNPMQIEQRLGRLHRVGQEHDVLLANLVSRGTIEERILHVLESKINLFELVVGELDMILGRVTDDFDFETSVFSAYVTAADDAEFAASLDGLGADLARARTDYLRTRGAVDQLVGEN
ncbi:MAG: DEAD/DEAH box helicase [Pseudonocardiaceae bacterium]